ncbi:helix-turn-helix domain-containing protein [Prevotella sp.]
MLTLSRTLSISKDELSIFFDQCMQSTFRKWLGDIRFNAAKKMMLECPDYSNDIISAECGFSARTYLYRILKHRK